MFKSRLSAIDYLFNEYLSNKGYLDDADGMAKFGLVHSAFDSDEFYEWYYDGNAIDDYHLKDKLLSFLKELFTHELFYFGEDEYSLSDGSSYCIGKFGVDYS